MSNISENSKEFYTERMSKFLDEIIHVDYFYNNLIFLIFMCIIFALSIVGNMLTCIVIYCDKSLHTTPNCYMFNLAISDFVVTLSIILQGVEQQILIQDYSDIICIIQAFFLFSLWNSNMLMMTALAVERFVAVCHPFRLTSTRVGSKVVKKIVVIWLIAVAESALGMFSVGLIKTSKYVMCFVIPTPKARIVNGVLAFVTFILPLTIMILAYSKIMLKVNINQEENTWNNAFNYQVTKGKINKFMGKSALIEKILSICFFIKCLLFHYICCMKKQGEVTLMARSIWIFLTYSLKYFYTMYL